MKFRDFIPKGVNLEIFRYAVFVSSPIVFMYYLGRHTHDKLNVPDFWPDPARLNQIPKDRVELKMEIERLRKERLEKKAQRDASAGTNMLSIDDSEDTSASSTD